MFRNKYKKAAKNKGFLNEKKAAIGATMTWVVATIIIVVVVIVFIYSSYVLAKEKKILGFNPFVQEIEQSSSMESEQILLALLETDLNDKKIREYVLEGDYGPIKDKISSEWNKMPDNNWEIYIYDGGNTIKINANNELSELRKAKSSIVYVGDKKVKLFSNLIG